jgi:hypothetical protein
MPSNAVELVQARVALHSLFIEGDEDHNSRSNDGIGPLKVKVVAVSGTNLLIPIPVLT